MKLSPYLFLLFLLTTTTIHAQFQYPPLSPSAEIKQQIGYTNLTVKYDRPSVRERTIFGALVPWNEMWITGAGEPTILTLDNDIVINKKPVKAGTYYLSTIPNPLEWTIVLNGSNQVATGAGFWENPDVVHFKVPAVKSGRFHESLTISIDVVKANAVIYLNWAATQVSFTLETDAAERVANHVTDVLPTSAVAEDYYKAASYYYYQNQCLDEAVQLAKRAIQLAPSDHWYRRTLVQLGIRLNDFALVQRTAREAKKYYEQHPPEEAYINTYWEKVNQAKRLSDLQ